MEIAKLTKGGVKIKTKNTTLLVDPMSSEAADVIIFTKENDSYEATVGTKLVVSGAGDYELGGVVIHSEGSNSQYAYTISGDNYSAGVAPAAMAKDIKDQDELDCLILNASAGMDKNVLSGGADTVILFDLPSQENNLGEVKKMPRVSLKKKEEIKGSIILLS